MLKIKPQNPKGVRDFLPKENQRREYIISVIKKHYERYGFESIYTPSFERLDTLQGKYGEEGDKLLFKILNSGEYLEKKAEFIEISATLKILLKSILINIIDAKILEGTTSQINFEELYREINDTAKKFRLQNIVKPRLKDDFEIKVIDYIKSALTYCSDCPPNEQLPLKSLNSFSAFLIKNYLLNEENVYFLESKYITKNISEKGLRYDLTVPLARLVSQHQNELSFPFKRYHIAPVWRADRPQKGRYQEFFQCDADIVGTKSLVADVEFINLIQDVFSELNLKVEIKINNRKVFNGICQSIGILDVSTKISTILDKWDKIGEEKVREELTQIIDSNQIDKLIQILSLEKIEDLESIEDVSLQEGVAELKYIFKYAQTTNLKFDLKLLRGLDYYTGTVLEVVSSELPMGSLLGGGRYDNLTEIFGLKDVSGIGISFGLDRIYDLMNDLNRFPGNHQTKKILILNLTDKAIDQYYSLLREIRKQNISIDLYPTIAKMDKQLTYADKCEYTHAILIGENELAANQITIKNLRERKQNIVSQGELLNYI